MSLRNFIRCLSLDLALVGAVYIQIGVLWEESRDSDKISYAVKHAAAQFGLHDDNTSVELIWRISADSSVEAAMQRMMASSYGLIGFVGPTSSDEARFAARVAAQLGLPLLSHSATAAQLDDMNWFSFFRRPIASDRFAGEALVAFASHLQFKSGIAVYDPANSYSTGLSVSAVAASVHFGFEVHTLPILGGRPTPQDIDVVRPYFARFCLGDQEFCLAVLTAAKAAHPPALDDRAIWVISESMVVHVKHHTMLWLANVMGVRPAKAPETPPFYELAAHLHAAPTIFEVYAYDCITALVQAFLAAGETGPALLSTIDSMAFQGASGPVRLGVSNRSHTFNLVQGGGQSDWRVVGTFKVGGDLAIAHNLITWPTDLVIKDPRSMPTGSRLAGRTFYFGTSIYIHRENELSYAEKFFSYLQTEGNITIRRLPLPCRMSSCVRDGLKQVEAGANVSSTLWTTGPETWDKYLCSYYGGGVEPGNLHISAYLDELKLPSLPDIDSHAFLTLKTKRQSCGVRFAAPHLTYRFGIYVREMKAEREHGWNFVHVFDWQLWLALFVSSALIGAVLHVLQKDSEGAPMTIREIFHGIFEGLSSLVNAHTFKPNRFSSRLLNTMWMSVVVLVTATYTANLAAVLTHEQEPVTLINSIADLYATKKKICVPEQWIRDDQTRWQVIKQYTELESRGLVHQIPACKSSECMDTTQLIMSDDPPCVAAMDYDFKVAIKLASKRDFCQLKLLDERLGPQFYKALAMRNDMNEADAVAFDHLVTKWATSDAGMSALRTHLMPERSCTATHDDLQGKVIHFHYMWGLFLTFWASCCIILVFHVLQCRCAGETLTAGTETDVRSDIAALQQQMQQHHAYIIGFFECVNHHRQDDSKQKESEEPAGGGSTPLATPSRVNL